ncbi:5-hydroxytryptamine receptor 2A, partial [Ceratitis capitata]|uniref:5-hydroxytryptamine receptor 2A n=1 Tax=Ceratitis capitata TaxID=7213 RepID=UPI0006187F2C
MTEYKDAHDYVFIADGSSSDSRSSYVISANLSSKPLNANNSGSNYNKRYSINKGSTHRRTHTKRPTTSPSPPSTPTAYTMLPISYQNVHQQHSRENSPMPAYQHRNTATHTAANAAEALSAATTETTAATVGFKLSQAGAGTLEGSSTGSNNHNLQQLPRQRQQHQHQQQYNQHPQQALSATTILTTTAITVLAAVKAAAATATATLTVDNLYGGVAVGLGAMLINDTLLLEADNGHWIGNGSLLFDDVVESNNYNINGSDLMLNDSAANLTTSNATAGEEDFGELLRMATTSVVLGLLILITIIGNVFVIAAIILERNLQNVANYLVASLAVADLLVACLVMPLSAVYEISQGWILGPELCDIWTSCDVLCCTASILHLVAIAVDRYWAVTNIDYIHSRTSKRVFLMIFCVWSAAVIVSLAPQFGWKDPDYLQRIEQQKCMVSQDVSYQVFATCCTFYVPLLVILALYWKIYQTARKRIHRRRPRPIDVTGNNNQPDLSVQKTRTRLRLRIGKFATPHTSATTTAGQTALGLVEGNSTNTVNTVEDTEFSSSNVDSKSRAGIESTTMFSNNPEEIPTTSTSQISTVSHLVALANQQHAATKASSTSTVQHQRQQQQQQ